MKKIMSIILTFMMILVMGTSVYADITMPTIGKADNQQLKNVANTALGYVQWFGYALAIGMLIYIGIKYMMASANEKADLKKGSINYVIGAIVVAGATSLVTVLSNIGAAITK